VSIQKAISHVGSAAKLARLLDVSPQAVTAWKDGTRPLPLDRAMQIERATSGAVTCEELRPDVDWSRPEPQKEAA